MHDSPTNPPTPAAGQGSTPPEPDLLARTEPLPDPGGTAWTVPSYIKEIANPQHPGRLGRYRIGGELGAGGMGQVFLAHDDQLGRTVALKIIRGVPSPLALDRFIAESRALARFDHPGIARVFDAGQEPVKNPDRVIPYFVMEHVPGAVSLTKYAAQHNLSIVQRIALLLKICDAVRYAHERGVIHRDLKPSNIIISADAPPEVAQPKIIDFGVAMVTDETQTHSGRLLAGTLEYMSPEQSGSAIPDTRADLYALGVILYELLTGTLPITVPVELGTREAVRVIREQPITPLRDVAPWLGPDLDAIITRALDKDPDRRYATVDDLAGDLRRVLEGRPISIRRDRPYRFLRHTQRTLRTRPAASGLALSMLLSIGCAYAVLPRAIKVPALNIAIESIVIQPRDSASTAMNSIDGRLYAGTPSPDTRGVVMVEFDPHLDLPEFARTINLPGIAPESPNAMRPFLARLLDRLGDAGAAVVLLDFGFFAENPDFDPLLAAAAERFAEQTGTRPVSASYGWEDPANEPPLPPVLTPWFFTGGASALLSSSTTFVTDVGLTPPGRPTLPSIALLAAAQAWHAGFDHSFERLPGGLEVRYHRRAGNTGEVRVPDSITVPISFSMVGPVNTENDDQDLRIHALDVSSALAVQIPSRDVIDNSSISITHALTTEPESLAARVKGAVVVVGNPLTDLAPREEFFNEETAEGTLGAVAGFEAQASAVALLLARRSMRLADTTAMRIIVLVASVLGFFLAHYAAITLARRVMLFFLAAPIALAASFLGVYFFSFYATPWLVFTGLLAGLAASLLVRTIGQLSFASQPARAGAAA